MDGPPILHAYDAFIARREVMDEPFDAYIREVKKGWPNPGTILVVAPMYRCFDGWCHKVGISSRNSVLRFAHSGYSLRGYDPADAFILSICPWSWGRGSVGSMKRDLSDALNYLYSMDIHTRHDECIENGRKLDQERRRRDRGL